MRKVLPKNAYMIVRDTAKVDNKYYQIIDQYYSRIQEYLSINANHNYSYNTPAIPGQEYTGITVYSNTKQDVSITLPAWW